MEKEELLELVAVLTLKNMTLEGEIKRLERHLYEEESKAFDNTIQAEIEAASRQAELEEARDKDEFFKKTE